MKVLLVGVNSKYIHTALAVDYIYGMCGNFDVEKLEFNINQNLNFVYGEILKREADVILFSTYIWNIDYISKLTSDLSQVTDAIIGWGGIESNFEIEDHFKENPGLDIIIRDEGELTVPDLLEVLENKRDLKNVLGISYREGENIFHNPPRPLIKDLDIIPSPFVDIKCPPGKIIYYEMSRGCPFKCTFCMSSTIKGVRYFSTERIKSDLLYIMDSGAKIVKLVDRTFNANERESIEMMTFIRDNVKTDMVFHMELMAHLISDNFLEFLSTLPKGLFQFEVGVQSSNPKTLEAIERRADLDRLKYVVQKIRSFNNIHQHVDQIAGLPYEDYKSFKESFNYIYSLGAEKFQLGFLKVLRGSKIKAQAAEHGIKFTTYAPYEVLETKYISALELKRIKVIEDLVEKFSNEDYFAHTLDYVIKDYEPFDFFEAMSIFWEDHGYTEIGHSRDSLYEYFYEFLSGRPDIEYIKELLRLDFISNNRKNPPAFLNPQPLALPVYHELLDKAEVRKLFDLDMTSPTKYLVKDFRFEYFNFNNKKVLYGVKYKPEITVKEIQI